MKNKNTKVKVLFILITLVAIICVSLIITINMLRNNTTEVSNNTSSHESENRQNEGNNRLSRMSYYNINTCMNLYLNSLDIRNSRNFGRDENGNYIVTATESQIKKSIYNLLSEKYINENGITLDNVNNYVKVYNDPNNSLYIYVPLENHVLQDKDISSYLIHGLVENSQLAVVDEVYAVINIDSSNRTFSVEPIKDKNINEVSITNLINEITKNENNTYIQAKVNDENIVKDYINLYKRLAIGSPEKMYELIDKEYRETRFGNVDEFKKYVSNNKDEISKIRAAEYQKIENKDYTQYVCIDQNKNTYIIKENSVFDFSIILDTYTIDIKEFTDKYSKVGHQEKVILNINKIMLALNNKDYKYVYSKLSDGFKKSQFPTLESFEKYVQVSFFEQNEFDYLSFGDDENGYYTYDISIINANNKAVLNYNKTFIMRLRRRNRF